RPRPAEYRSRRRPESRARDQLLEYGDDGRAVRGDARLDSRRGGAPAGGAARDKNDCTGRVAALAPTLDSSDVIPGHCEAANPESITTVREYRFRAPSLRSGPGMTE